MSEQVYEYLFEYGFNPTAIDEIENVNDRMFFTNLNEVIKNINFLESKQLNKECIINVIKANPFILTETNERLKNLDDIYLGLLRIDYESMIEIIINNPETYSVNPIELQKNINYLIENNCNTETIKKLLVKNPKIINMKFIDFKKIIKFN